GFGNKLISGDKVPRRQRAFDGRPPHAGRSIVQVDRHAGRPAPFSGQLLEVHDGDQETAENEQRQRDDGRRHQGRLKPAPQTGGAFVERVAQRPHQATSTMRPWSSVKVLRPTRRINSRSWVATTTVVPRALISRKMFMISSARSGSRLPVGSSASTS